MRRPVRLRQPGGDRDGEPAGPVQSVQRVGGKVAFGTVKTDASRRSVTLDSGLVDLLRAQRRTQAANRLLIGPGWVDRDRIFAGPTREPIYPGGVTRAFAAQVKRLGHANVGITLNIHGRVAPVMPDDAAQAVADLVRAAGVKQSPAPRAVDGR